MRYPLEISKSDIRQLYKESEYLCFPQQAAVKDPYREIHLPLLFAAS